ncbi:MAG TPA: fatty acyl-AMP ligase, partial [Albitalea sp.]|nr:fatty acyl-AMP ligase [Albitalea sp.]
MHSLAHHHHDTSSAAVAAQAPRSLVDLLRERAQQRAGHPALMFLADGETESARLDYHELDRRARAVAATLQRDGLVERPVLLMLPSGVHYVVAFLGCLYAGAVPVPGYPPGNSMHAQRMAHIAADCRAGATIVAPGAGGLESIGACRMLVIADDGVLHEGAHESAWVPVPLQPETLAYLQYTSGSTSQPRGVMVTHGNLLAHAQVWAAEPGLGRDDVFVSWLPLFHDMGLILGLLQMLGAGGTVVLMPPLAFLQRPLRWLAAISRYRGTASYAPNFAYALCAASNDEAAISALDLSCWAVAGNGAEPVRADTIAAFVRRFAAQGFRSQAMNPGYGLAEATLTVSRQPRLQAAPHIAFDAEALSHGLLAGALEGRRTRTLVACGRDWPGVRARVVDPVTRRLCSEGRVGELWVDGPVVAAGYWQRDDATQETFGARLADGEGPFLRTGDLGAWFDGQLFITGRRKDLIVVRGQNHHPQDIEHTVQGAHPMLEPGHGAAFSVEHEGEERLVVVQEVRRSARRRLDGPQVAQAIRAAVAEAHG